MRYLAGDYPAARGQLERALALYNDPSDRRGVPYPAPQR